MIGLFFQSIADAAPQIRPTFVIDSNSVVTTTCGGEARVTLSAIPSFGDSITFTIRDNPKNGRLSKIRNTSDNTAEVTYTQDGSTAAKSDRFTFCAQAPGKAKSCPAGISIKINNSPPCFICDHEVLNFGDAILGNKLSKVIQISNTGGEKGKVNLQFTEGYSSPLGNSYVIAKGESLQIPIEFCPMKLGEVSGHIKLLYSNGTAEISLKGIAIPRMKLNRDNDYEYTIKNISDNPFYVNINGPATGWVVPPDFVVTPKSEKSISFLPDISEEEEGKFNQSSLFNITDGFLVEEIKLPATTSSELSVLQINGSLGGDSILGKDILVSFHIRNESCYLKHFKWCAKSSYGDNCSQWNELDIDPMELKEVKYKWYPHNIGIENLTIYVQTGSRLIKKCNWKANVIPSSDLIVSTNIVTKKESNQFAHPSNIISSQKYESNTIEQNPPILPPIEEAEVISRKTLLQNTIYLIKIPLTYSEYKNIKLEEKSVLLISPSEFINMALDHPLTPPRVYDYNILSGSKILKRSSELVVLLPKMPSGNHSLKLTLSDVDGTQVASSEFELNIPRSPSFFTTWRLVVGVAILSFLLIIIRIL